VIPDVTGPLKLEIATLKRLYDANAALVVDAREVAEYAEGHIRGAVSLPYNDAMAEPERVKKLDPAGRPIVIYCSGGDCELSMDLARVLIEAGKRRVLVYEGGYPEWQSAGYEIARGPNP
jgi:rhodanese-related sulfurtransferase